MRSKLDDEERSLTSEKLQHIREIKRVADEDASIYNNFPRLPAHPTDGKPTYLLTTLLGRGGFSEVYEAYDLTTFTRVACKIHALQRTWVELKREDYIRHASREYAINKKTSHRHAIFLYELMKNHSKNLIKC